MLSLQYIGGFISIFATYLIFKEIKNGDEVEQNFVSWILWGLLDTIATISTIMANGNWILPITYASGAFIVSCILFKKRQINWTWIEMATTIAVFICLMIWLKIGNIGAIIGATTAICLSGIPQMVDTWKKPSQTPTFIYIMFSLAEILSFFGGKSWSIEEKFYAGGQFIICVFIISFSLRGKKTMREVLYFKGAI